MLGYVRVSTEEQTKGTSLVDQQNAIRAYAKTIGMDIARFFVEAESGILERREQIRLLMSDVRAGDLIVVAKLDRWSRDVAFSYSSVDKIVAAGADFYLISERCGPHDDTWDTIFGVHALVAKLEHKRIKERLLGTRRLLRDDGLFSEGKVPLGYQRRFARGQKGADKNALVIVEHEAAAVRAIYAKVLEGYTLREIGRLVVVAMPDGQTRKLTHGTIRRALGRRFYTGEMQNTSGEWIAGKHPAIIDVDTFVRSRDMLGTRRRAPAGSGRTEGWLLRDVARCALCGSVCGAVYGGRQPDGSYSRVYYLCVRSKECGARNVRVEAVEAEAEPLVVARLEALRTELARPPTATVVPVEARSLAERRAHVEQKRARLVEQYTDGDIARDEYKTKLAKHDADLLRLDNEAQASGRVAPLADPALRRAMLASVEGIRSTWADTSASGRRRIVRRLALAARIAHGQKVEFVWRTPDDLGVTGSDR